MEVTEGEGPLLTLCATTTHLLSEFLTLQVIPQTTREPRGSFLILFGIFVYVQTSKYKPVFKRLHHCHRWCKIIHLFLFTVSLFLLYMDIRGLLWHFFNSGLYAGNSILSCLFQENYLKSAISDVKVKERRKKMVLKKKPDKINHQKKWSRKKLGWAEPQTPAEQAQRLHHCECHVGDRKDKSQKQTRLAHVPPLQFSANLHFFSLRT